MVESWYYLAGSLGMLALCGLVTTAARADKTSTALAGLLSAPYAAASVLFVPAYWQPVRVTDSAVGIEDVIFSFAAGGLAWALALAPNRHLISFELRATAVLTRYLVISVGLFVAAVGLMFALGWSVVVSFLVAVGLVCAVVVANRPNLWRLCRAGMLGYGSLYFAYVLALFAAFPGFRRQWNGPHLTGLDIVGVPVEEIAYGVAFGALWPVTLGFAFGVRLRTEPQGGSS